MLGFTAWVSFVITLDFHHIRRTMKQASQGPISTRARETMLRITENKRKLLWGLSEILGEKKENSEQSKIYFPNQPSQRLRPESNRKTKATAIFFIKFSLGYWGCPSHSIMSISLAWYGPLGSIHVSLEDSEELWVLHSWEPRGLDCGDISSRY